MSNLYTDAGKREAVESELRALSFVARRAIEVGGTTITVEDRP